MEYRYLGRSGLRVSVLTMGTMTFGGVGGFKAIGDERAQGGARADRLCLDAGVNLIDTANIYSSGESEKIIGEVLGGKRPNDLLIASKVRFRHRARGRTARGCRGTTSSRQVEASLGRLRPT